MGDFNFIAANPPVFPYTPRASNRGAFKGGGISLLTDGVSVGNEDLLASLGNVPYFLLYLVRDGLDLSQFK